MAGGHVPHAIVLALGAGVLGGPDALRLLLRFAGRSGAAVDLAICFVVISLLTVGLLGTVLLARFVRKPAPAPARAGRGGGRARGRGRGGRAPATNVFAQFTAAVSVGAALLVTACLLVVPGGGGQIGGVRVPINFAALVVCAAVAAAAAAAATGSLPCAAHLRARSFRGAGAGAGRVGGAAAPAAAPAPATTASRINKAVSFVVTTSLVGVAALAAASRGFDAQAQLLFPEFQWRSRIVPVGAAIVTVAGATLLVVRCYSRRGRARSAAGAGAAGARTS